jgi:hypothetical protein
LQNFVISRETKYIIHYIYKLSYLLGFSMVYLEHIQVNIHTRNMLTPQHFDFLNDQTTHENDKTTEKQKSKILD